MEIVIFITTEQFERTSNYLCVCVCIHFIWTIRLSSTVILSIFSNLKIIRSCPFKALPFPIHTFFPAKQSEKLLLNCFEMPFVFTSSMASKKRPFDFYLNFENRKKITKDQVWGVGRLEENSILILGTKLVKIYQRSCSKQVFPNLMGIPRRTRFLR